MSARQTSLRTTRASTSGGAIVSRGRMRTRTLRRPAAVRRSAGGRAATGGPAPPREELIEIAIALVEREGRYLIGLRPPGVPLAGLWEFPGGKVQPGEAPRAAARRECREEAGIDIHVTAEQATVVHRYEHAVVRLHFFAATPRGLIRAVAPRFRWVAAADLDGYTMPEANRAILAQLLSPLRRRSGRSSRP